MSAAVSGALEVMLMGFVLACVAAFVLSGAAAVGYCVSGPTKVAAAAVASRSVNATFLRALAATTGAYLQE